MNSRTIMGRNCGFLQVNLNREMDLNRMKNASKLDLCRKYYFGKYFILPKE